MRCWDLEGREEVTLWEHREGCLEEVVQGLWGLRVQEEGCPEWGCGAIALRVTKEGRPGGGFFTWAFSEGVDTGEAEKGKGICGEEATRSQVVGPGLACAQAGRRRCPRHWTSGAGPPPVASEVGFWIQLPPRASDRPFPCLWVLLMTGSRPCRCPRASSTG